MFRLPQAIALLTLLAIGLIGCGASNPMVGTWKFQVSDKADAQTKAMAEMMKISIEFKADNTYVASMEGMGKKSSSEGTYKLEGNTLTLTQTKEDGKAKEDKPQTVTLSEDKKSFEIPGSSGMGTLVKQ